MQFVQIYFYYTMFAAIFKENRKQISGKEVAKLDLTELVKLSNDYGSNEGLCLAGGGNTSPKG